MGKNLKGKECGKGICQRKDGLYLARFVDKWGKRHEKYFKTLPEARNWLEEAKYADKHEDVFVPTDTTVDAWLDFWIENIVGDLAPNTIRNYRERYVNNIQPVIGRMLISNVRPMHCKKVLVKMDSDYAGFTIRQTYIAMGTMLGSALMNGLISKHPIFINYAMKRESIVFVCTRCVILMQQGPSKAVCNQRFYKNFWGMRAFRPQWTDTSMLQMNLLIKR